MNIAEKELQLKELLNVKKGSILQVNTGKTDRESDALVFIRSGSAFYDFGYKSFTVKKGDILFLPFHSTYKIQIKEHEYSYICVDFFFEHPERETVEADRYPAVATEGWFEKMYHLFHFGTFAEKVYCKGLFYRIYSEIIAGQNETYLSGSRVKQIREAAGYIADHYREDLSVSGLAAACHMSEVYFRKLFKEIYHLSPQKYLIRFRLNKAKELLGSTELSIAEISAGCGFETPYYFTRIFKQEVGITPTMFRKRTVL